MQPQPDMVRPDPFTLQDPMHFAAAQLPARIRRYAIAERVQCPNLPKGRVFRTIARDLDDLTANVEGHFGRSAATRTIVEGRQFCFSSHAATPLLHRLCCATKLSRDLRIAAAFTGPHDHLGSLDQAMLLFDRATKFRHLLVELGR